MDWEGAGSLLLKAIAGAAIVALNAFFVAAEFALIRVRDTQLQPLDEQGSRCARLARRIIARLDVYLSTVQLGITLCGLGMGALVEPLFSELLLPVYNAARIDSPEARRTISFLFGFLVNTFVLIAIGELAPKSYALRRAVPIALMVAYPLHIIYYAFFPLIVALNKTSSWVLARFGLSAPAEGDTAHSEEELRLLISSAQRHRGPAGGHDVVLNALDLRLRKVREVMQPRPEVVVFDTDSSIDECIQLAEETRYSRFPLCTEGDLDRIIGIVHIKDLYAHRNRLRTAEDLRPYVRHLIYVPETARLERVMHFLLERRLHMAIVVDEYGSTVGLITLENILEELVGQIQDEFDQERPLMTRIDDDNWELAGSLPLHDLAEIVEQPIVQPGISSVSGWITQRLGGFPRQGDSVPIANFVLHVEETRGPRVTRLRLTRVARPQSET